MVKRKNKKTSKNRRLIIETALGKFTSNLRSNSPSKGYTITVPKLKGLVTFGKNLNEAKTMAKEAIELHCECLLREGLAELKVYNRPVKQRVQVYT